MFGLGANLSVACSGRAAHLLSVFGSFSGAERLFRYWRWGTRWLTCFFIHLSLLGAASKDVLADVGGVERGGIGDIERTGTQGKGKERAIHLASCVFSPSRRKRG